MSRSRTKRIAATLVRLTMRDTRDDPRYTAASRRMALAIAQQYDDVRALVAKGIDVGVFREAVR